VSREEQQPQGKGPGWFVWLEHVTAAVLLAVVLALGWILLAAYSADWAAVVSLESGVGIVLALLTAALLLVSVVALLHTRGK
jgi:hypothetical protein